MNSAVIALREKLLAAALLLVLVATLVVTRRQQTRDAHRNLDVLPRAPQARELARAFPVPALSMEALQAAEDFASYAPLLEHDPFVRVQTPATESAAPAPSEAPVESQLTFRGRVMLHQRQMAVIEVESSHETFFVGVGQEVEGFQVIDIAEERVVLSKPPDQQVTLRLADDATRQDPRGSRGPQ